MYKSPVSKLITDADKPASIVKTSLGQLRQRESRLAKTAFLRHNFSLEIITDVRTFVISKTFSDYGALVK